MTGMVCFIGWADHSDLINRFTRKGLGNAPVHAQGRKCFGAFGQSQGGRFNEWGVLADFGSDAGLNQRIGISAFIFAQQVTICGKRAVGGQHHAAM